MRLLLLPLLLCLCLASHANTHSDKFHDLVLSEGFLPLSVLEAKVDTWIDQQFN